MVVVLEGAQCVAMAAIERTWMHQYQCSVRSMLFVFDFLFILHKQFTYFLKMVLVLWYGHMTDRQTDYIMSVCLSCAHTHIFMSMSRVLKPGILVLTFLVVRKSSQFSCEFTEGVRKGDHWRK